jgi:hypothetical protein
MKRFALLLGLVVATIVVWPGGGAQSATNCRRTTTSGSGASYFSWCFSDSGNVMKFESPRTKEHIHQGVLIDGYALCAGSSVQGWDAGETNFEGGFRAATYPAANKVFRTTTNGRFRLEQTFTQDAPTKTVLVTTRVVNLTGAGISGIRMSRYTDYDVGFDSGDDVWTRTATATQAKDVQVLRFDGPSATTKTTAVETLAGLFSTTSDGCTPDAVATPVTGDYAGRVTYALGTVAAHQGKTVVFRYRRTA